MISNSIWSCMSVTMHSNLHACVCTCALLCIFLTSNHYLHRMELGGTTTTEMLAFKWCVQESMKL